ncbi:hypothetical protein VNO78_08388 [Psophocarpus tetragonolobus]|uniref:Uncharacterized protein n=1 Tax=Psophocarpus tetragonolobus TaxID=3891 RepID=A0AAN9SWD2_PSOTE
MVVSSSASTSNKSWHTSTKSSGVQNVMVVESGLHTSKKWVRKRQRKDSSRPTFVLRQQEPSKEWHESPQESWPNNDTMPNRASCRSIHLRPLLQIRLWRLVEKRGQVQLNHLTFQKTPTMALSKPWIPPRTTWMWVPNMKDRNNPGPD